MAESSLKAPKLGGRQAWLVWIIAVAFVVYYFSFQTGYAIVNARMQEDLGLSIAQVGMVAAIYTWVFALCQFVSGPLLDRIGARKILLPAILLVTLGIFVFANSNSFEMLLVSQTLIALGACTGFVGAGYVGCTWFGLDKFSFMFGLVQFSASLFSAFNQNILSWSLTLFPWDQLFNLVGILGILLFGIAYLYLRDPVPVAVPTEQSFGAFLSGVAISLMSVARLPHIWMASAFGSLCFGGMLGLGVVWGPKLLMARGVSPATANAAASFLWLGLAAGCFIVPWISDRLRRRKLPILIGISIQILAVTFLFYARPTIPGADFLMCLLFGFGNAAHMLAFSTAGDVVEPKNIGTSAAIVNGVMFILGGIMISRPGVRIGWGIEEGLAPESLELAQFAGLPFVVALILALVIAILMKETYPQKTGKPV
ncbi:MAG: MFS transporter [Moraxellaceae bacterium]